MNKLDDVKVQYSREKKINTRKKGKTATQRILYRSAKNIYLSWSQRYNRCQCADSFYKCNNCKTIYIRIVCLYSRHNEIFATLQNYAFLEEDKLMWFLYLHSFFHFMINEISFLGGRHSYTLEIPLKCNPREDAGGLSREYALRIPSMSKKATKGAPLYSHSRWYGVKQ